MKLVGRCSTCQAQFKVEESQAAKKLKCPKCGGFLVVPAAGDAPVAGPTPGGSSIGASPIGPASEPSRRAPAVSPGSTAPANRPGGKPAVPSPFAASRKPVAAKSEPLPPAAPPPASESPADAEGSDDSLDFLSQSGTPHSSLAPMVRNSVTTKSGGSKAPWIIGGVCVTLLAIAGGLAFALMGGGDKQKTAANDGKPEQPATKEAKITIDITPADRKDATLRLDENRSDMPAEGMVSFSVKPGKHKVFLGRMGYVTIEKTLTVKAGDEEHYAPKWEPLEPLAGIDKTKGASGGSATPTPPSSGPLTLDDWSQDADAALKTATADGRDVLIAFLDSNDSDSIAMQYQILLRPEFRTHMEKKFAFVVIDISPRPQTKVQDKERNKRTLERFGVRMVPSIVLLDAKGQPFGALGYEPGGLDAFLYALPRYVDARAERDQLFQAVDAATGDQKVAAAQKALAWLKKWRLASEYQGQLQQWQIIAEQADPKNEKGLQEAFFSELFMAKLRAAFLGTEAKKKMTRLVEELEQWKKNAKFRDQDQAVTLHLSLAFALEEVSLVDAAEKVLSSALTFTPKDEKLKEVLKEMEGSLGLGGSGSGFVVADEGYILTNHHVIKDAKRIEVRVPALEKPVPAKLIADDSDHDMALIKVDLPAGLKLKPLHVAADAIGRGTNVGAFGFPLTQTTGRGLKLTTGSISALPDKKDGMYILDVRVNPGNSGGALCDARGFVVGMVTAKTYTGGFEDSYGMAIPSAILRDFIGKHVPKFKPDDAAAAKVQPAPTWDKVDGVVSSSVLMILNRRK